MSLEPPRDWTGDFQTGTLEPVLQSRAFHVIDKRLVSIDVDGLMWIKRGSAIAYRGDFRFHLEPIVQAGDFHAGQGPARNAVKRELVPLSKAEGRGRLFVCDGGRYSQVVRLQRDEIYVASSNLLAFDPTLEYEILTVGRVGLLAGGLLVVKLSGTGLLALSVDGEPLTLRAANDRPVSTDPTATIAWSGDLWPALRTDLDAGSLVGHGGGQPIQMCFRGDGHVVVHATSRAEAMRAGVIKRLRSRLTRLFV